MQEKSYRFFFFDIFTSWNMRENVKVHFSAGFREIGDMALSWFWMALKNFQVKNKAAKPPRMALMNGAEKISGEKYGGEAAPYGAVRLHTNGVTCMRGIATKTGNPKTLQFFFACGGLSQRTDRSVYSYLPPPQKAPNFFRLRRAVTKMCIWLLPPLQKAPNFFRLRRAVTKMSIYFPQNLQFFSLAAGCY